MKRIIRKYWSDQGSCSSCGWHAGLEEYDVDLDDWNSDEKRFELPCMTDNEDGSNHRGVRIYPSKGDIKRIEETIKKKMEEV